MSARTAVCDTSERRVRVGVDRPDLVDREKKKGGLFYFLFIIYYFLSLFFFFINPKNNRES